MRNSEELLLLTIINHLSEYTGIPSGQMWIDKPASEFINNADGPNSADTNNDGIYDDNQILFPAINIEESKQAQFADNNYGGSFTVIPSGASTGTIYEPLADVTYTYGIYLYTKSKKDLRDYGNLIEHYFMETGGGILDNDILSEPYSTYLLFKKDPPYKNPYCRIYYVECQTRILKETTGYVVEEIQVNTTTDYSGAYTADNLFVYINSEPSNPLIVDFSQGTPDETIAEIGPTNSTIIHLG